MNKFDFEIVPVYVLTCCCSSGESCQACRDPEDYYTITKQWTLRQTPVGVVIRFGKDFVHRVRKFAPGGITTEYHLTANLQIADRMDHDSAVKMIQEIEKIMEVNHD